MTNEETLDKTPSEMIGQRVRNWRLHFSFTQSEVAQRMKHQNGRHFSVSYVSAVERGHIRPSLDALDLFAKVFNIPAEYLLSDKYSVPLGTATPTISEVDATAETNAARLRKAQVAIYQHRLDDAKALAEQVLAESRAPRDLAMAQFVRAQVADANADWGEAASAYKQTIETADQAQDRNLAERARLALGDVFAHQNKLIDAVVVHATCLDAVQKGVMQEPGFRLHVYTSLGSEYAALGKTQQAVEMLTAAVDQGQLFTDPSALAESYWQLSQTAATQGDNASARRYVLLAVHAFGLAESRTHSAATHARLGLSYLATGHLEGANTHLHLAIDMARTLSDTQVIAEAAWGLTELAIQQDQLSEAEMSMREARQTAEAVGDDTLLANVLITQARLDMLTDNAQDAESAIKDAVTRTERVADNLLRADLFARLSAYYESRGDVDQALAYLKSASQLRGNGA